MTVLIITASYRVVDGKFILIRMSPVLQTRSPKSYTVYMVFVFLKFVMYQKYFPPLMVNDCYKQSRGSLFSQNGPKSEKSGMYHKISISIIYVDF